MGDSKVTESDIERLVVINHAESSKQFEFVNKFNVSQVHNPEQLE
jgi:hypothetical protein